jgi:signal transduction histidine kinase
MLTPRLTTISADQLEAILDGMADGTLVHNAHQIVYANDAAAHALGIDSAQTLLSTPLAAVLDRLQPMAESGQPLPLDFLSQRLLSHGEQGIETVVRYQVMLSGEERWAMVKTLPLAACRDADRDTTHLVVTIIRDITQLKRAEQMRQQTIVEERERIARELHDSLAQILVYVNASALAIEKLLHDGKLERAVEEVVQLARAARTAYADVREEILGLRVSLGPGQDVLSALREYLRGWQELSGISAELSLALPASTAPHLPPGSDLQLIRIIQEALANSRKHAAARHAHIHLEEDPEWLEVVVADDGVGFDPLAMALDERPHFGLAMMRERAEVAGGALTVESSPGSGTQVTIRLPVELRRERPDGA